MLLGSVKRSTEFFPQSHYLSFLAKPFNLKGKSYILSQTVMLNKHVLDSLEVTVVLYIEYMI